MNRWRFALRSVRFYWAAHFGVLAGATLASAVLIGALDIGDSVRISLRLRALQRLAGTKIALATGDRFFTTGLVDALATNVFGFNESSKTPGAKEKLQPEAVVLLPATVSRQDGTARVNQIQVIGVSPEFFGGGQFTNAQEVRLNPALASRLGVRLGDEVILRIHKPSALSADAAIAPRDESSVALRFRVGAIVPVQAGANLSLQASQVDPFNAFVPRDVLARAAGISGRANLGLLRSNPDVTAPDRIEPVSDSTDEGNFVAREHEVLARSWRMEDAELSVRGSSEAAGRRGTEPGTNFVELTTRRVFLDPAIVDAATRTETAGSNTISKPIPILAYLVNGIYSNTRLVPYSIAAAAGPPYTPADLQDDEVVINQWLAADLNAQVGDPISLTYYRVDSGSQLVELTNQFKIRAIVPMQGVTADSSLMPEFPGLAKAESTRDWDTGFQLVHKIRPQDEAYWKKWRGTPKVFLNLKTGQRLWGNRFGNLTSLRWPVDHEASVEAIRNRVEHLLVDRIDPRDLGFRLTEERHRILAAAKDGQDFGGLFIGFSFFLIAAALLLTAMLFQFAIERRATEVGVLLALGWTPKQARALYLREGVLLAAVGSVLGALLAAIYARLVIWGLSSIWSDAVAGAALEFHQTAVTLISGVFISFLVGVVTLWLALRRVMKRPARELLAEGSLESALTVAQPSGTGALLTACGALVAALGTAGFAGAHRDQPELFFCSGALLLVSLLLWVRLWIRKFAVSRGERGPGKLRLSIVVLAIRGVIRRPSRSLGTVALLASAAFLIVAVGAYHLDAGRNSEHRESGTGGFALWARSALPVFHDLNRQKGQEYYGFEKGAFTNVTIVPMRVRNGDDASCLNLNQPSHPRVLGVDPAAFAIRNAFTFVEMMKGIVVSNGWMSLNSQPTTKGADGISQIPAIGDASALQWILHKAVGETLDATDERGQPFRYLIVGTIDSSVLQGNLLIAEENFVRLFPNEAGYREFLVDAPVGRGESVAAVLSKGLQDVGFEVESTVSRLSRFNAVQNTYLETFQLLGGLGLILGSVGLGIVVLRNLHERRGELGLMLALGFETSAVFRMALVEHLVLLGMGLGSGVLAAMVAVLPSLLASPGVLPWRSLGLTLLAVLVNGLVCTAWAVRRALSGRLVDSLREL
jgi:ABC-type antimicrobial peptide transport system permease subunit